MFRGHFLNSHAIPQFIVVLVSICAFLVPLILAGATDVFATLTPAPESSGPIASPLPLSQRVVTNNNDDGPGSLRQAIIDANPGDTITFAPNVRGVIALKSGGTMFITENLTIVGPGPGILAISGAGSQTALRVELGATVTLDGLTFRDGPQFYGVLENAGSLTISDSQFDGEPFYHVGTTVNPMIGWRDFGEGALPFNDGHSPSAPCYGPVAFLNSGIATVTNSTFAYPGLGIGSYSGSVLLSAVTISETYDFGIANGLNVNFCGPTRISVMTVTNSTITAGILNDLSSTLSIVNSIVSLCAGPTPISSLGHNLTTDSSCNFTATGDITSTNLLLVPLADYGGPTWTRMPLPGSPVIDAGDNANCPATDQRGVVRPIDGNMDGVATCDIGAVEFSLTSTHRLPLIMR